jgi:hypothetical protein
VLFNVGSGGSSVEGDDVFARVNMHTPQLLTRFGM